MPERSPPWLSIGLLLLAAVETHAGKLPARIELPSPVGVVHFDHTDHAGRLECGQCHNDTPPGQINVDETFAHNTCLGCHRNGGTGPTTCHQCHRKATKKAGQ